MSFVVLACGQNWSTLLPITPELEPWSRSQTRDQRRGLTRTGGPIHQERELISFDLSFDLAPTLQPERGLLALATSAVFRRWKVEGTWPPFETTGINEERGGSDGSPASSGWPRYPRTAVISFY